MNTGLVSVTFRNLGVADIIQLVKEAGLDGIEWGGDIHVPAGDVKTAEQVRALTKEAGLEIFSYGSYYIAGENENPKEAFLPVLKSAVALGAPLIRVWAGALWSFRADLSYVEQVTADTQIICDMADEYGIRIAYEYHGNSLTDTGLSALDMLQRINRKNMELYWQANYRISQEDNELAIAMLLPHVKQVHVDYWELPEIVPCPLDDGKERWRKFIARLTSDDRERCLMLEFVKNGDPKQFLRDAKVLKDLLKECKK